MNYKRKLDEIDWALINAIHLDPRRPLKSTAIQLRKSESSLRSRLFALESSGLIRRSYIIDLRPLGFSEYSLWFSGDRTINVNRSKFFSTATNCSKVISVSDYGTEFEIVLCARDANDLEAAIDEFAHLIGGLPGNRSLSIWKSWKFLPRCPGPLRESKSALQSGRHTGSLRIDEIDHTILKLLGDSDQNSTSSRLAHCMGLPQRTIHYRLSKLEQNKILLGCMYTLDSNRVGRQLFALAISVHGPCSQARDHVRQFLDLNPAVCSYAECLGYWDFEAQIEIPSEANISQVLESLNSACHKHLSATRLVPLLSRAKLSPYPFRDYQDVIMQESPSWKAAS